MKQSNFLVVGDTILDCFLYGDATRISPEAPALVLDVREEKHSVGGAFNVFSHITSLGGEAVLATVTGSDIDKHFEEFPELVAAKKSIVLLKDPSRMTSIKTRLVATYKLSYLARFDKEETRDVDEVFVDSILRAAEEYLVEGSSLLIVDYKKGVVTQRLAEELITLAATKKVKVYVDSKRDEISRFAGAYLFKPNKVEFHGIKLRYQLSQMDDVEACRHLLKRFQLSNIILTLGAKGMVAVSSSGESISVPGHDVTIKELSGAGDSVLAVLASLLGQGFSLNKTLEAANNIAARFVSSGVSYRARTEDLFVTDYR